VLLFHWTEEVVSGRKKRAVVAAAVGPRRRGVRARRVDWRMVDRNIVVQFEMLLLGRRTREDEEKEGKVGLKW
jgi:hypothetical protein